MPVWSNGLSDTPVAVVDFETTGLSPKTGSRVVEVAVVRIDPGEQPRLVLDTLVDPNGPVRATRIHGITDEDVLGAPLFSDIVANVAAALEGAVVAAFNAAFDIRFLESEFQRSTRGKSAWVPPHMCLMYMRPLLGLGPKCSLADACAAEHLPAGNHRAAGDAMAAARLWLKYRAAAESSGVRLFDDLETGRYAFTESFDNPPYDPNLVAALQPPLPVGALKPRLDAAGLETLASVGVLKRRQYWHLLVDSLADGVFNDAESASLLNTQRQLALTEEDIRAVHARVAADWIQLATEDESVSAKEVRALAALFVVLRHLGWAPGDAT